MVDFTVEYTCTNVSAFTSSPVSKIYTNSDKLILCQHISLGSTMHSQAQGAKQDVLQSIPQHNHIHVICSFCSFIKISYPSKSYTLRYM